MATLDRAKKKKPKVKIPAVKITIPKGKILYVFGRRTTERGRW